MHKTITTIIVDDEPLARKGLAIRLQQYPEISIVAQCTNGNEALDILKNQQVDLMFLDIQMPVLTGFEVLESAIAQGISLPIIIFVTAFDEFALKAFEVHATDYLLKPVSEERLAQTIEKINTYNQRQLDSEHKAKLAKLVGDVTGKDYQLILQQLADNQPMQVTKYSDILAIKDAGEVSRVPVVDIQWIDAAGDYMCVHTQHETHILRKTMKQLEAILDPRQFIRTHRSVIVNHHFVEKFCSQLNGEYYLVLKNGKELKVSRSYKDKVKQIMSC
jgi:two-component system LytT family response regulator